MKKLKSIFLLMLSISLVSLYSCKKDEDNDVIDDTTNTEKTCYVNKIETGDGYEEVEYNSLKKVIRMTSYDSLANPIGFRTEFTYDSDNQLSLMEAYESGVIMSRIELINGSDGKPDSASVFSDVSGSLQKIGYLSYTFNGDKLVAISFFIGSTGTYKESLKYEYFYDGGNVNKSYIYESDTSFNLQHTATVYYESDNKKNPLKELGIGFISGEVEYMNVNNSKKVIYKDSNGTVMGEIYYSYDYNDNNYPTKMTETDMDSLYTDVTIYTYTCE